MTLTALDFEQIRTLVARYAFALDLGDAGEFIGCFTIEGGLAFSGLPEGHPFARRFEGHDALREFHELFRGATQGRLRHIATNVDINGDGDGVSARSYLLTVSAGAAATNGATGIYRDEVRNVGGQWLFAQRQITVDS